MLIHTLIQYLESHRRLVVPQLGTFIVKEPGRSVVFSELLKRVGDFDLLITAESKGIPLAYEMSRQSGKKYILARKSIKLYMHDPVSVSVKSITTAQVQTLYLDSTDMEQIRGKRILIVDDVVSTGESMHALECLVEKSGGVIAGKCAVLAEGDARERTDVTFLGELPLFFK